MQEQSTSFLGNIIELSDNVKSQQGGEINLDTSMVQEMVHYEGIDMFDGANVNNELLEEDDDEKEDYSDFEEENVATEGLFDELLS